MAASKGTTRRKARKAGGEAAPVAAPASRLLTLEVALLRALAEAEDLPSALPSVLRLTCEGGWFSSGSYWTVAERSAMLLRGMHYGAMSGAGAFVEGAAAPSWLRFDPVWLADVAREARDEWRSTLIVPVAVEGRTIGALELCATQPSAVDAELLRVLRGAATLLGKLHARAAAAERLRESESRLASTMALAAIGISHVDDEGRFLYVNPQLCAMLGYTEAELLALTVRDISHPEDVDTTHELSTRLRQGSIASYKVEKRYVRKDGTVVWAGLTIALKRDASGRKLYDVSIVEDISARKEAEQCIQYLANHDALTGLPNRARFAQLLAEACEAARRDGSRFAVLFIDLDRFKVINDTLGHEGGDAMLRAAAGRLRGCVRSGDVVARLGGDEFVILLRDVGEATVAGKIATNVLNSLVEPVTIFGTDCTVSASIGICLHPDADQPDQAVLRNADMAMYLAKQSGKNGYRLYVNELNALSAERAALEAQVRSVLERGAYEVRFDARLDASTSAVVAFDAYMRFTDSELAAAASHKLASAMEAGGLLVPINRRILRAACDACAAWRRAGLAPVRVALSVAAGQLTDQGFVGEVREALERSGARANELELHATEDALLYDAARSARTLATLKALGVKLAVEAFGTGKASFADLQRFSLDALHLHATRIEGIELDVDKQRYAEGVVALARALNLRVVATGVANAGDAEFLRESGCDALQGPIGAQALSAADCEAMLREAR